MSLGSVFHWILLTSMAGGLMALFILAFRLAFGSRLRALWRWALWSLLILRLLPPSGPVDGLNLYDFLAARPSAVSV
jgi:hypothetical protein